MPTSDWTAYVLADPWKAASGSGTVEGGGQVLSTGSNTSIEGDSVYTNVYTDLYGGDVGSGGGVIVEPIEPPPPRPAIQAARGGEDEVPHFALPFRLAGARFAVIEQDTDDEVLQSVEVIVRTRLGERIEVPDFGIPDPTFGTNFDSGALRSHIARWEPRANTSVASSPDSLDELIRRVSVGVQPEASA